ncbi:creatininase family protein [Pseudonocardia sp. TRM90224]|uniref:creatininase family protein n=1 Tax=Pseudonocardia sp. TRM90224 TaxID=2812678 RepID=UPI001E6378D7|nr:creatininase family protein [Pseudonocardia sp. TRM90224]
MSTPTLAPLTLATMTTVEAAAAVTASPLVILPAGALEQHGTGLPLGTDTVRAEHVAQLVAQRLDGGAVIGPTIPVGVSPHHMGFAGTVTLTTSTFATLVREYVDSLHAHGWRRFLVITGHGGNGAALSTVAQDLLTARPDVEFAWTPLTPLAAGVVADMAVSEVHGHSGEAETAQMLALAPHLVHPDRLTAGTTRRAELDPLSALARRPGAPNLTVRYDRLAPTGVLGDPRRATATDGLAIVEAIVEAITAFATDWLKT